MSRDVLIRDGTLTRLDRTTTDVTAMPDGATLIAEPDWAMLVLLARTEAALMKRLGVVEASGGQGAA